MLYYTDNIKFIDWIEASAELVGDLPNLPMPLAIKSCLDASRDLFKSIQAWRYLASIDEYNEDTKIATIKNPPNAQIFEIVNVFVDGQQYSEVIENRETHSGHRIYKVISDNELIFEDGISVYYQEVNVRTECGYEEKKLIKRYKSSIDTKIIPSVNSDGIPETLLNKYSDGIRYKAFERIHKSPNQKLFNADLAKFYRIEYEQFKLKYLAKPSVIKRTPSITKYSGVF